jgi:hypothetical protein
LKAHGLLDEFINGLTKKLISDPDDMAFITTFFMRDDMIGYYNGSILCPSCGLHLDWNGLPVVKLP